MQGTVNPKVVTPDGPERGHRCCLTTQDGPALREPSGAGGEWLRVALRIPGQERHSCLPEVGHVQGWMPCNAHLLFVDFFPPHTSRDRTPLSSPIVANACATERTERRRCWRSCRARSGDQSDKPAGGACDGNRGSRTQARHHCKQRGDPVVRGGLGTLAPAHGEGVVTPRCNRVAGRPTIDRSPMGRCVLANGACPLQLV